MNTGIFIDDTGNPGKVTESRYDTVERKSWLALILTPENRKDADYKMRVLIDDLKREFGADEFHFKDIYNGNGKFKGIDLSIRKMIFQTFANIFAVMKYPMLIQTMTNEDWSRNKLITNNQKIKKDNFKLKDTSDFALFCLLFRINIFLKSMPKVSVPVDIIIDEGRQKPNTKQRIEIFGDLLHNKEIHYQSSREEPLLQLVDYAAFCLNRARWILAHKIKNRLDVEMLEIFSFANFNVLNMEKRVININEDTTALYDKILEDTYAKHNHLGNLELDDLIRNFYD